MNLLKAYKHLESEIVTASAAFHVFKGINDITSLDDQVHSSLQNNAQTWKVIIHCMQSTFFITLGRLFDRDKRTLSVDKFLCLCIVNIEEFSHERLRERKVALNNGVIPDWLETYMEDVYVPNSTEFQKLRGEVKTQCKLYEQTYGPIRNQVIAHKELSVIDDVSEMFQKTNINEIQKILIRLHQVRGVIFHLYHNGRLLSIDQVSADDEERMVKNDIESVLQKLKQSL